MSRMLWVVIAVIVAAMGGAAAAWKLGFSSASVDAPPPIAAFQSYLLAQGVEAQVNRVRDGSINVRSRTIFQVRNPDHVFFVLMCKDKGAAQRELERFRALTPQSRPEVNGTLLLYVPDTPDDSTLERVRSSFRSFKAGNTPP